MDVKEKVFADKLINVWVIVYDYSGENMYVFSDYEAVKKSVIGSIWSYCTANENDPSIETVVQYVNGMLEEYENVPCIPIVVDNLSIIVYRFTIDSSHIIHKVLSRVYNNVEKDLQDQIRTIFNSELSDLP